MHSWNEKMARACRLLLVALMCFTFSAAARAAHVSSAETAWKEWMLKTEPARSTDVVRFPFSFHYDTLSSEVCLKTWKKSTQKASLSDGRQRWTTAWTDAARGVRLTWETTSFTDSPAVEWVLYFENTGTTDSGIWDGIEALDWTLAEPLPKHADGASYRLHKTKGPQNVNRTDFEPTVVPLHHGQREILGAGGGRSSNQHFPFLKVESGAGSYIVAIGWSGQWKATAECPDDRTLHLTAGMEKTHFRLHPGEKVRSPRILILFSPSGPDSALESNVRFRELLYRHYCAKRNGQAMLPTPFCNTAFTRGGYWLNECNETNQISLIKAYAPLGLEALITDAGWSEGGWPAGMGNWNVRKDAYPHGLGPVAAAARENGMSYGLWFEPERVVAGTEIQRTHPEWLLGSQKGPEGTYLLNFGLPEVQDYFFNIVNGFMELPGFRFYRQDFNMDPLPYWRFNDTPDRQGITEIRYIEGLYAYWDRIAKTWPDSLREECASGGRRIDLETIQRMQLHQKSDYWFDNETDQASLWSVSQYLPNNVIDLPLTRLDDYSFHSTLASSLVLGWIADAPDFDAARAKKLLQRYLEVRDCLVGPWYPLRPYSQSAKDWMASQYQARTPDGMRSSKVSERGIVVVVRRAESPESSIAVALHGLEPKGVYELTFDTTGEKRRATGAELMKAVALTLPEKHSSELILYRRVKR